jgi:two-component system sensor histidine kinase KdpD
MRGKLKFLLTGRWGRVLRNLLPILIVGVLTAALAPVKGILVSSVVGLLYLLAVLVCATQWGLGAGIIASVCSFLAFDYFFLGPYYTLTVYQTQDILVLFVFLVVAIVSSQLVGRVRASLAEIKAHEQDMSRLHELSGALIGLHDEQSIVQLLVDHVFASFDARIVRVSVQSDAPLSLTKPEGECTPDAAPAAAVQLMAESGKLGQIELWRAESLSENQARLLRTFASEGVLALERARMARAETRASVLQESDQLKSAILSSVSHELRTPLVTIKAAVTSLRRGEVDWSSPAREELLAALEEETDRLNQLVANLLNMSRLEVGALKPQRQWNVLAETVDATVERLAAVSRQHQLHVDVSDDLPLVPFDASLIDQVLANLISNSVKYTPLGSTIRISARQQDLETLLVEVANEGPPVPPEHLVRIFDKFHRVTLAERVPGIGLGLSICKGIVEAHGGRIWAENLDPGFAFRFTLPMTWEGGAPPRLPDELE